MFAEPEPSASLGSPKHPVIYAGSNLCSCKLAHTTRKAFRPQASHVGRNQPMYVWEERGNQATQCLLNTYCMPAFQASSSGCEDRKDTDPASKGPESRGETDVWTEVHSGWQSLLGWKTLSEWRTGGFWSRLERSDKQSQRAPTGDHRGYNVARVRPVLLICVGTRLSLSSRSQKLSSASSLLYPPLKTKAQQ